ncbi:hypothetical protein OBBRIDRAFT_742377 [Obba rivulosa]|uniref:Uncharacterized protein n=1 Tax=Obba rivulosa TaxID=1052685 RepID=A0A8E2AL55_9APHY|nr:hypothetical protein OBBRIDRAFT_742377 [Obba rivulosa]
MLAAYDAKWLILRTTADILPPDSLRFHQIPWPILEPAHCVEQMTKGAIRRFLEHPSRLSVPRGKTREEVLRWVVKRELLRWHPDKFHSQVLSKAKPDQRSWISEVAAAVTRALTEIMAELAH